MSSRLILLFILSTFFFSACNKTSKEAGASKMEVWGIDELKAELLAKKTNLDELCQNKNLDKKTQTMCEDISKSQALKEKMASDESYEFFLDCAKSYSETMTSTVELMKELDPEGYKTLHFGDETALYKYIALPETTRVMASCEYQAESKYWNGLIKRASKADLEFCIDVMKNCQENTDNQCPKDKDKYLAACEAKLK